MEKKMAKSEGQNHDTLEQATSISGDGLDNNVRVTDAVFGEITEDGPNYRNVNWIGMIGLMIKTQLGLGVLSLPACFDVLGLIPGIICIISIAIMTTWTNYVVGVFKRNHREVYGIEGAGHLMFGAIGREVLGGAYIIYYVFITGSAILSVSIGLNAVSSHGACTAVFVAVAFVWSFLFSSIRTLARFAWLAWAGLAAIITAIMIVTISVGIQDRPALAPQDGKWASDYKLFNNPSFTDAISAVSAIVFSFGGTPAFFALASEMRQPELFSRSLAICQVFITVVYIIIGCVVYVFCGSYVASPALGSAGVLIKQIAYGIALPGLLVTTMLLSHLPAKSLFVRVLRGSEHLVSNSWVHWTTWIGCTFTVNIVAYLIASGIPIFGNLVSLVGALLGSILCFQPMGCMWLYDNWGKGKDEKSPRWLMMVAWSVFIIIVGTFLTIAGTYGTIVTIINSYTGGNGAWSCADNSNS